MALRKPLVIVDGKLQQIQSGDTLNAVCTEVDVVSMENGNAGTMLIGHAVYVEANDTVELAQADAAATVEVLGLVQPATITAAASGYIITDGVLTATTDQWDVITGDVGGLTAGTVYYLDPDTAGLLTTTAPTTVGDYVVRVGKALSTLDLEISISQPILL